MSVTQVKITGTSSLIHKETKSYKKAAVAQQIKSRERVSKHGEVFTAEREVNSMIDLVGPYAEEISTTVLEPACGEGVFLINILKRKLDRLSAWGFHGRALEWHILRALSSLYGVDIQRDNVEITRGNLRNIVYSSFRNDDGTLYIPSLGFKDAVEMILKLNIIAGNTLTGETLRGTALKFPEWNFDDEGLIFRRDYSYNELIESGEESTRNHRRITYRWMQEPNEFIPDIPGMLSAGGIG